MGPHTFNFAHAAELALEAGAALRVPDLAAGVDAALRIAADPRRGEWVQRAFDFAASHRGAAQWTAQRVLALQRSAVADSEPLALAVSPPPGGGTAGA
jgi:3-deoxy-D-manno-octulosonic-acid transferase